MNRKLHKVLALALIFCMTLTLLPALALAALPAPAGLALGLGDFHDRTRPVLHWTNEPYMENGLYRYAIEMYEAGQFHPSSQGSGGSPYKYANLSTWTDDQSGSQRIYNKAVLQFEDDDGNTGPAAELPINLTINQVVSSEAYTATFSRYRTATFELYGLPADTSVTFTYVNPSGAHVGLVTSTGSGGRCEIEDNDSGGTWSYGLGDMEMTSGEAYYVDVVQTTPGSELNTAVTTITRHPVNIVFDERPKQAMSWSGSGGLSATYGDGSVSGKTASTNGSGSITYTSSDSNVAEVDAAGGSLTVKGAGKATITATAAATETYRETSISYTLTVNKKPIAVTADNKTRAYGQTNPALTFTHNPSDLAAGDTAANLAVSLSCLATALSPAGTAVDITGDSDSANYAVTVTSGALTITKAAAPSAAPVNKSLLYSQSHPNVTVNIARLLPQDRGETSFTPGSPTGDTGILSGDVTAAATGIQFSANSGDENLTATIPVTVTMTNYADVVVNVVVKLVDKIPVEITGVAVADKTYDGLPAAYTGAPANEEGYDGEYEYIWSGGADGSAPKDAGSHSLTVKIPEDSETHMGEVTVDFTISSKALTVKPKDISIYNGDALPTVFELEYAGIVSGDTVTPAGADPAFALKNGDHPLENSNTNGSYTIQWTNKDALAFQHISYSITKADGALTISSRPSGGDGGGSGSGTPAPAPAATPATSISGDTATIAATLTASVDAGGTAVAEVSAASMAGLIESAKSAEKDKKNAVIEIKVTAPASAKDARILLPKASLDTMAKETGADMRITTGTAVLTFDNRALTAISSAAASGDIQISIATVSPASLPAAVQLQTSGRPVYDFSVTAGSLTVSDFKGGSVGVSLPYTPAAEEDLNAIVIYYISDSGRLETVTNGVYDPKTGTVVFTASHFSSYAIGYNKVQFKDVAPGSWYENAVSFIAARGVTYGIGGNNFGPDTTLTRGEFIVMLMRAYGIAADVNPSDNFADAGSAFYSDYLAAAKRLGISGGVGGNKFMPEKAISRQEMFALLHNTLKVIDGLPQGDSGKTLADFADAGQIDSWAKEAMALLVKTGVVGGNNGKLEPTGSSTRAQMAQVLHNLFSR